MYASYLQQTDDELPDNGALSGDENPENRHPTTKPCVLDIEPFRVLVMERALVVCHSRDRACLEQERVESFPNDATIHIQELEAALLVLRTSIDQLPQSVNAELDNHSTRIDTHLNRHLDLIDQRIDRLDQDWRQRVDGNPISAETSGNGSA